MERLKSCPFCGKNVAEVGTVADIELMDRDNTAYYWASEHYQVVCDYTRGGCGATTGAQSKGPEDAIEAWNRRPNRNIYGAPQTDLAGKCGSCKWAVKDTEHFGKSQCYIRCTNPEKKPRRYYGRQVSQLKQRTAKACLKYEVRDDE